MENIFIVVGVVVWYFIGLSSFIYWWTKDDDLTVFDLLIGLLIGVIGLLAFFGGWVIHGETFTKDKVIIKRRN